MRQEANNKMQITPVRGRQSEALCPNPGSSPSFLTRIASAFFWKIYKFLSFTQQYVPQYDLSYSYSFRSTTVRAALMTEPVIHAKRFHSKRVFVCAAYICGRSQSVRVPDRLRLGLTCTGNSSRDPKLTVKTNSQRNLGIGQPRSPV